MGIFRKAFKFVKRVFGGRRKAKRVIRRRRGGLRGRVTRPFMVKKTIQLDRIQVVVGTQAQQVISAELADLPQYTTYTALYDQYKINKVTVRYRLLNPVNIAYATLAGGTTSHVTLGMVHSAVDNNDITTVPSIQSLMNDNSYFGTKSNRDHVRSWKPKFLLDAGGSAPAKCSTGWLSSDYPNVSHYGLKTWFEPGLGPTGFASFYVEPIVTYYVSFKDQKN